MVKLFNSLDYEVKMTSQGEMIHLEASFAREKEGDQRTE
jgi:hypothetical protein